MKDSELSKYAHDLAEMTLANGFDEDAYILKVLSELDVNQKSDLVPDSTIDETIQDLSDQFVKYFSTKNVKTLQRMMRTIRKIISELFNTAETNDEREVIKYEVQVMQSIR